MRLTLALIMGVMIVSACSNQGLRTITSNSPGPDEFIVEPKAELVIPDDLAALPAPTPGGANLTDKSPLDEVVVALGGRPSDANAPIPSSDGALVTAASRFGVTEDIRETLAATDAEFRRKQSRFTQYQLFPEDRYNQAYRREILDATETARAWRRLGVRTPSFPPS